MTRSAKIRIFRLRLPGLQLDPGKAGELLRRARYAGPMPGTGIGIQPGPACTSDWFCYPWL